MLLSPPPTPDVYQPEIIIDPVTKNRGRRQTGKRLTILYFFVTCPTAEGDSPSLVHSGRPHFFAVYKFV